MIYNNFSAANVIAFRSPQFHRSKSSNDYHHSKPAIREPYYSNNHPDSYYNHPDSDYNHEELSPMYETNHKEKLSFIQKLTSIVIPPNSPLQQRYLLLSDGNTFSGAPSEGLKILGFHLFHDIVFQGKTLKERKWKQQQFERKSQVTCIVNRMALLTLSLAELLSDTFVNDGGSLIKQPKYGFSKYRLPQPLWIGSGIPFEIFLYPGVELSTDEHPIENEEDNPQGNNFSIDFTTEAVVSTYAESRY